MVVETIHPTLLPRPAFRNASVQQLRLRCVNYAFNFCRPSPDARISMEPFQPRFLSVCHPIIPFSQLSEEIEEPADQSSVARSCPKIRLPMFRWNDELEGARPFHGQRREEANAASAQVWQTQSRIETRAKPPVCRTV